MANTHPKRKQKEFVKAQEQLIQRNASTIENEVNKMLDSTQFSKYLPGKNNTLKKLGWEFQFIEPEHALYLDKFRYLNNALGLIAPDCYPIVFDDSSKHWLGINWIYKGNLGLREDRDSFYSILKHEIAHCIDYYLRGKKAVSDKRTNHDKKFHLLNNELWGDPSLGDAKISTKMDLINKFAIVFEPSLGCPKGAIKLIPKIPEDYYSLKYTYSSIVRLKTAKVIKEWFPDNAQKNYIEQNYSIDEIKTEKQMGIQQNINENFEELYDVISEGKLGNMFKTAAAAASIFGSTLGGPDLYAKQVKDNVPQTQSVLNNTPVSKNKYIVGKNGSEKWVLAATLYAETRGESLEGKKAVASVIYNRAKKRNKSFKDICLQNKQFSCWNNRDKMNVIINNKADKQSWVDCWEIATQMVNNNFEPIIKSDHYYNPKKASPSWGDKMINKKQIGNHLFGVISKK